MNSLKTSQPKNSKLSQWLFKSAGQLGLTLPVMLAVFSAVAMFFLVIGQFRTYLVWPIGLVAAYLAGRYVNRISSRLDLPGSKKEHKVCSVLVITGIIAWTLINIPLSSQHVFVNRDPGTYTVTGAWLVTHNNLHILKPTVFSGLPAVATNSNGFGFSIHNSAELFAQGSHLLPALLGLVGRIAGYRAMLHANVIFGAFGLLAVYGFARLIMKPRWALVITAALAASLPLLYFSRDTYTEPLAMTFTFSALAMIWLAQKTQKYWIWFLAGLVLAAGTLTRIDAYLSIAAIEVFLIIILALSQKPDRLPRLYKAGLLMLGTSVVGVIGWADSYFLSSGYYQTQWPQIRSEFILILALLVLGAVTLFISWKTPVLAWLDKLTSRWRSLAAAGLVLAFFAILASRPLWYVGHEPGNILLTTNPAPIRSYAEQTINWIVWYLGPALTALGIVGMALAAARIMKNRLTLLPIFMIVATTSLVYLIKPSIAPDQIWASRRLLPIILPGLAIFGGLFLEKLYELKNPRVLKIFGQGFSFKATATSLATLAVVGPLFVSYPFLTTRTYVPELGQLDQVCQNLPANSLMVWLGSLQTTATQSTAAFCNRPAVGIVSGTSAKAIASLLPQLESQASAQNKQVIIGIASDQAASLLPSYTNDLTPVSSISYSSLETSDTHFPRLKVDSTQTILLASLQPGGRLSPIEQSHGK